MCSTTYKEEVRELLPGLPPYHLDWTICHCYEQPRTWVWAEMVDPEFKSLIKNDCLETVYAHGHILTEEDLIHNMKAYLELRIEYYDIKIPGAHQLKLF